MPRKPDESRRNEIRRLAALDIPRGEIATRLGIDRGTVTRALGSQGRTGPPRNRAVPDSKIIDLRDRQGLSWAEAARLTGMSETGVKNRWRRIKGLPRYPDRKQQPGLAELADSEGG